MLFVGIEGGNKKERDIAESVVRWCISKLLPKIRNLKVVVKLRSLDIYGFCNTIDDDDRWYVLEVNRGMNLYDLISTLCHEMVHVKQYVKGEMKYDWRSGKTRWKAKLISDDVEYLDQPWEKEAYKLEEDLAKECFREIDVKI